MSKYVICPECEGEGYIGTLGAFTPAEMEEYFGNDVEDYYYAHETSAERCAFCNADRVVTAERNAEWDDYREYQAERAAEQRMGC